MDLNQLIGQEKAKSRIEFYLDAFRCGKPYPNLMFVAPRGMGKTTLAEATGLKMREMTKGQKRFFSINATSVKNLKQFWNSIVLPVLNDRDATLLIDECHKLKDDVTTALLTMINPNENNKNSYTYDDYTVDIDLKRQNFFFCTTEPHKLSLPFMSRTRRIDLEPYTQTDLVKILKRNAPNITFENGVLDHIAPSVRGVARQAVMVAKDIETYLAPKRRLNFNESDWNLLRKKLDILPLGLTRLELQVLQILNQNKECSLTRLAATLGMAPAAVKNDLELYLLSTSLMEILGKRNITQKGRDYLKALTQNTK